MIPQSDRVLKIITLLREATRSMVPPASVSIIDRYGRDPFLVLVSCILSLRTQDKVSLPASIRLFELAKTPQAILALPRETLVQAIYPVGFYRTKATTIYNICHELITRFHSTVPHTYQELIALKGVGPKTANLVLGSGFGIPAICVDTHVHRISNRLGLIATKTVEQTQLALEQIVSPEHWIEWNHLLVMWGQNVCLPRQSSTKLHKQTSEATTGLPRKPKCSQYPAVGCCRQIGTFQPKVRTNLVIPEEKAVH